MNKILFYSLISIALLLAAYNAYLIDFTNLFADKNFVASVSALAALAAVILLLILNISKKIAAKSKG